MSINCLVFSLCTISFFIVDLTAIGIYISDTHGNDASNCGVESSPCKTLQYSIQNKSDNNNILIIDGGAAEEPLKYRVSESIELKKSFQFKKDDRSTLNPVIIASETESNPQIKYAFSTKNLANITLSFASIDFRDVGIITIDGNPNLHLALTDCTCQMERVSSSLNPSPLKRENFVDSNGNNASIFIENSWFSHYSRDTVASFGASITNYGKEINVQIINSVFYGSLFGGSSLSSTLNNVTVIDSKRGVISCERKCRKIEITNSDFLFCSGRQILRYYNQGFEEDAGISISNSSFIGNTAEYILSLGNVKFQLLNLRMEKNYPEVSTIYLFNVALGLVENLKYHKNIGGQHVFFGRSSTNVTITDSEFSQNEIITFSETSGGAIHLYNVLIRDNKVLPGDEKYHNLFESKENGIITMQNVNISGTQSSQFRQGNLITGTGATIRLTNVIFSNNLIKTAVKSSWSDIYLTNVLINNNEAYGTPTALDIYNSNLREARNISLNRVTVVAKGRENYNKGTSQVINLIDSTERFVYNDVQVNLRKYQTSCIGTAIKENINFSTYVKVLCPAQFSPAFTKSFAMHYFPKSRYQINCVQCLNFTNEEVLKYSSGSVLSSTISTISQKGKKVNATISAISQKGKKVNATISTVSQKGKKLNERSSSIQTSLNINLILFLFLSSASFIC